MKSNHTPFSSRATAAAQAGFTLVELVFVIAVIAILAALATPYVREFMIEGRVEPTSKDIINLTNVIRASGAASGSATPYASMGTGAAATAAIANAARGRAVSLLVAGTGATATVAHQLGASGSQISASAAANPTNGDTFSVVLPTVNKAACPNLATQLNRVAEAIDINGTVVKAAGGAYDPTLAENSCTADDTNTYTFTFR